MTKNNEREKLDVRYFNEKLRLVLEGLQNYTRSELSRELQRLSNTASPISQNEHQEVVGYIDEFGNFENSLKQWMVDEPDVKWKPLYTSPNKQIPDGWKLIGKVSEMGVVWHKQNPHAHPVGTEFYALLPTTSLTSETNTEVGE